MSEHIIALLKLFQTFMPDQETVAWVLELASSEDKWKGAHQLFGRVRSRNLAAIDARDRLHASQYSFEEICLKALYNESGPLRPISTSNPAPFDTDSPYWIVPIAIDLARKVGIPVQSVIEIIAPEKP